MIPERNLHSLRLPQEPRNTTRNNEPEDRRGAGPCSFPPLQPRPRAGRRVTPLLTLGPRRRARSHRYDAGTVTAPLGRRRGSESV